MRVFTGITELEQAVGEHLGYSSWHTLTQEQVDAFAGATGDKQWIHVDQERAATGPFGTTIAHGFLTLALVPMLAWEVYTVEGVSMAVNYGVDKLRFPAPVPVGSRVRAGVELMSTSATASGTMVSLQVTIEIEASQKPGCVVDLLSLVVP